MRFSTLRSPLLTATLLGGLACANGSVATEGTGGSSAEGGNNGTGGNSQTGGTTGTGGVSTGGIVGTGGVGTGGIVSTGGIVGTGGHTGGSTGSGGVGGRGTGTGGVAGRQGTGGSGTGGSATGGIVGTGGTGGMYVGTKTPGTAQSGDISVNPGKTYQVVDGFGLADVWQGSSSAAMQTLLWDPVNGIGLNLLRVGIDGTSGSANIMGAAGYADGTACVKFNGSACKVWAAPWSPPASMKDNNNVNNGGHLNSASYAAWAKILAAFPAFYKSHGGVDLYAISAQNEPDFTASYQSCIFNSSQMTAWVKVLGPALAALSPPVKVLAAEPDNWGNIWGGDNFSTALLADSTADSFIGVMATHDYGGTSAGTYKRPAPPASNKHPVWETECTPGDTGPITIATMIYAAFSTGGVNGWHYWWTQQLVPNASSPPPQVYALGNFSKYVRPGYYRADVTGAANPSGTVPLVVAFTNPPDGTVVIVVVNGGGAATVNFFVAGSAWPASVTPYVTTTSSKLAAGSPISVSAGRFSASLAGQSVTTFVGKP